MDLGQNFWIKSEDTVEYAGILSEKSRFKSAFDTDTILQVQETDIVHGERYLFFETNNGDLLMARDFYFKKINKGVVS